MLANILQIVFYCFLAVVMFGEAMCQMLGITNPTIMDAVKGLNEGKIMYSIAGFFIFAQISTSLRATEAFEITINDELVYSKLETGKHVDGHTLTEIFEPYGVTFHGRR